jgi:ATPase complex subunit ATP10
MILSRTSLRVGYIGIDGMACLSCQWRSFSTSFRSLAQKPTTKKTASKPPKVVPTLTEDNQATPPSIPTPVVDAPKSYGRAHEKFEPKPLPRPIGLPYPPRAGENTGVDKRTLRQRRDDFVDYDKHLARRKELSVVVSYDGCLKANLLL